MKDDQVSQANDFKLSAGWEATHIFLLSYCFSFISFS